MHSNRKHSNIHTHTHIYILKEVILKEVTKAVNIDIHHLKRKQKQLKTELYNTILHNEFKTTCAWIKKKVNGIQQTVRQRLPKTFKGQDRLT